MVERFHNQREIFLHKIMMFLILWYGNNWRNPWELVWTTLERLDVFMEMETEFLVNTIKICPTLYNLHQQTPYIFCTTFTGGLGNYTPSKIQMSETPFQLGVSRGKAPVETAATPTINNNKPNGSQDKLDGKNGEVLRPTEDAISWSGSSSSSDILF